MVGRDVDRGVVDSPRGRAPAFDERVVVSVEVFVCQAKVAMRA
jgi:hypothetical protein